ncbi:hypothetical protein [Ruminococcus gauvreauii]|uniref:hypothetical protein n=1 Tax=Ruminococcus gauvreauii TaxID=438033 RepID=UPI003983E068
MEAITTALVAQFTEIGTTMTGLITSILPIALPIMGAIVAIGFGIRTFKKFSRH